MDEGYGEDDFEEEDETGYEDEQFEEAETPADKPGGAPEAAIHVEGIATKSAPATQQGEEGAGTQLLESEPPARGAFRVSRVNAFVQEDVPPVLHARPMQPKGDRLESLESGGACLERAVTSADQEVRQQQQQQQQEKEEGGGKPPAGKQQGPPPMILRIEGDRLHFDVGAALTRIQVAWCKHKQFQAYMRDQYQLDSRTASSPQHAARKRPLPAQTYPHRPHSHDRSAQALARGEQQLRSPSPRPPSSARLPKAKRAASAHKRKRPKSAIERVSRTAVSEIYVDFIKRDADEVVPPAKKGSSKGKAKKKRQSPARRQRPVSALYRSRTDAQFSTLYQLEQRSRALLESVGVRVQGSFTAQALPGDFPHHAPRRRPSSAPAMRPPAMDHTPARFLDQPPQSQLELPQEQPDREQQQEDLQQLLPPPPDSQLPQADSAPPSAVRPAFTPRSSRGMSRGPASLSVRAPPGMRLLRSLSEVEVGYVLHSLGMGRYAHALLQVGVTGEDLAESSDEDLRLCGLSFRPHRMRLLKAVSTLLASHVPNAMLLPGSKVYDSLCGPLDSPPSSPTPQQRQQPPHSAAAVNQDHPPAPDQHDTSHDGEPRLPTPPEMWLEKAVGRELAQVGHVTDQQADRGRSVQTPAPGQEEEQEPPPQPSGPPAQHDAAETVKTKREEAAAVDERQAPTRMQAEGEELRATRRSGPGKTQTDLESVMKPSQTSQLEAGDDRGRVEDLGADVKQPAPRDEEDLPPVEPSVHDDGGVRQTGDTRAAAAEGPRVQRQEEAAASQASSHDGSSKAEEEDEEEEEHAVGYVEFDQLQPGLDEGPSFFDEEEEGGGDGEQREREDEARAAVAAEEEQYADDAEKEEEGDGVASLPCRDRRLPSITEAPEGLEGLDLGEEGQQDNDDEEEEEEDRQGQSALALQRMYRGFKTRERLQRERQAATRIQSALRGRSARETKSTFQARRRRQEEEDERAQMGRRLEASSTKVQSLWRGHQGRKQRQMEQQRREMEGKAVALQRVWRGHQDRRQVGDLRSRQQLARRREEEAEEAQLNAKSSKATVLQGAWRGHRDRKRVRGLRRASLEQEQEAEEADFNAKASKAVVLQGVWRGHRDRKRAKALRRASLEQQQEAEEAEVHAKAARLQCVWRGHRDRKRVRGLRRASLEEVEEEEEQSGLQEVEEGDEEVEEKEVEEEGEGEAEKRKEEADEEQEDNYEYEYDEEDEEEEEAAASAVGLQSSTGRGVGQGLAARPGEEEEEQASVRVQTLWRGHAARRQASQARQERSEMQARAVRIQSAWRGSQERRQASKLRAESQRSLRRAEEAEEAELHAHSSKATVLQGAWRGHRDRKRVRGLRRASLEQEQEAEEAELNAKSSKATVLQGVWRGHRDRKRAKALRRASLEQQQQEEAEEADFNAKASKAVVLQGAWRGHKGRKRAKELRRASLEEVEEEEQSGEAGLEQEAVKAKACTLQRVWRGHHARREVQARRRRKHGDLAHQQEELSAIQESEEEGGQRGGEAGRSPATGMPATTTAARATSSSAQASPVASPKTDKAERPKEEPEREEEEVDVSQVSSDWRLLERLPQGWGRFEDRSSTFYFNPKTGQMSMDHPFPPEQKQQADAGPETAKQVDEWERFTDPATGRHYVINKRTQASEWTNTWTEKKLDINAATGQQPASESAATAEAAYEQPSYPKANAYGQQQAAYQDGYGYEQQQQWAAGPAGVGGGEDWVEYFDESSGAPYYYNIRTGESAWNRPAAQPSWPQQHQQQPQQQQWQQQQWQQQQQAASAAAWSPLSRAGSAKSPSSIVGLNQPLYQDLDQDYEDDDR